MASKIRTLRDGLIEELKDLYSAENQLLRALPKMEKKASNPKLKEAFKGHLEETQGQIERLDEIGKILEVKLSGKTCKAMKGLIEEGSEVIEEESENDALIDALLIGAAQRVEHYEMAGYGGAQAMALELGEKEVVSLLEQTLQEEVGADKKLSSIAKSDVLASANLDSTEEDEDGEDEESRMAPSSKSRSQKRGGNVARVLGLAACLAFASHFNSVAFAENERSAPRNEVEANTYKGDNTGRNVRDRNESRTTADDQKLGGKELDVLARIRREIVANEALSTNAQNVKIVVEEGKVILRGPVKSAQEKNWIQ